VKGKVRRRKEEIQRSGIRRMKENPEVRFQRSEVTGE
jgi:cold shock CspA family protein